LLVDLTKERLLLTMLLECLLEKCLRCLRWAIY